MGSLEKPVRQSVTLPPRIARRVRALAKKQSASTSRVIAELVQTGLESMEQEKERFFALTDRLVSSENAAEKEKIKEELARMTFGE